MVEPQIANSRQLRLVRAILIAAVAFSSALHAQDETGTDGPVGPADIGWQAQNMFAREQYEELDAFIQRYVDSEERLDDGRWPLSGVLPGIVSWFDAVSDWDYMQRRFVDWRAKMPDSAPRAVVEAAFWIDYAWAARGGGYASSVTPEGWVLFQQRISIAKDVLDESKDYAAANPLWYHEYLTVANAQGWDLKEYGKLFAEAIEQQPYYYDHYFSMTEYLQPKWHGDFEEIEDFARAAVERTKAVEGDALYARIYWYLDQIQPVEFNLFEDSYVSWESMKKGFEDLMERYPNSQWNLNNFASFACRAGDKITYQKVRKRIQGTVFPMAWPSNFSLEICDIRMALPKI